MFSRTVNHLARDMAQAVRAGEWDRVVDLVDDVNIGALAEWRHLRRRRLFAPSAVVPLEDDGSLADLEAAVGEAKTQVPVGAAAVGIGVMEILLIVEAVLKLVQLIRELRGK